MNVILPAFSFIQKVDECDSNQQLWRDREVKCQIFRQFLTVFGVRCFFGGI